MRKVILMASVLLIAILLPLLAPPALASDSTTPQVITIKHRPSVTVLASDSTTPQVITIKHRPPPGMVFSQDLVDSSSSINPQPDLGWPNYYAWAFYKLEGDPGYKGGYAHVHPQTTFLDTDWWTDTQEYWIDIVVTDNDIYYAEIGLDITYQISIWCPIGYWVTTAYAGYKEVSGNEGTVFGYLDLGWSVEHPSDAILAVYYVGDSTWEWSANGQVFATHTYPHNWEGYVVHSTTEAYNQPAVNTNGDYISIVEQIALKNADNGLWYSPGIYVTDSGGVTPGWMVDTAAGNGYHWDWSTRQ